MDESELLGQHVARTRVSRRQFLRGGALPSNPFIHVSPPVAGSEMSTITDFNGVVAAADIQGTANNGSFFFDADMRFMQGLYVGTDGRLRQGSFGFI